MTRPCIQYPVIDHSGKECEKAYIYIYSESPCAAEINTTLCIHCTSIKFKTFKKKKVTKHLLNFSQKTVNPGGGFLVPTESLQSDSVLGCGFVFLPLRGTLFRPWSGKASYSPPPQPLPWKPLFSFPSFLTSTVSLLCLLLYAPSSSPCLFPVFASLAPSPCLSSALAANQLCHSQQSSCPRLGEPASLVLDDPGTRQRLWSLGSSIAPTTKLWWKKVSSKEFTLRPVAKENGDIVTAASFCPLSSWSKTCPLQRDGMRFSTIWECSVTQYYLAFPPCFMLLSDPWVLPSSQRSMTLRWLANFPIIRTVNGRTIEGVILYFASLSLRALSPLIPRYQTQKPK